MAATDIIPAMINYSIVMRSINSNLFDINQAKGRIKAAKAAGETRVSRNLVGICIQVSESEEEELFVCHSSKVSPEEFDFGIERLSHGV